MALTPGTCFFGYLKILFPSIFAQLNIFSFRCEICELANSHRVLFLSILDKSLKPSMTLHYDVWGPS